MKKIPAKLEPRSLKGRKWLADVDTSDEDSCVSVGKMQTGAICHSYSCQGEVLLLDCGDNDYCREQAGKRYTLIIYRLPAPTP